MQYLTAEDVVALYREGIGEPELRYCDGLASAVGRPQQSAFGEEVYPTLTLKAAALMQSLAENHCFVDGNKRIAWICTKVFLQLNEVTMHAGDVEGLDLLVDRVAHKISIVEIADWIARRVSDFNIIVSTDNSHTDA